MDIDYLYDIAYRKNIPVSVMIELLTKCNMRCSHCYLYEHNNDGFSFDTISRLLYEFRDLGIVNVSFTGGEIFLCDDIFEIISLARKLYMRVFLLSNATLLDENSVDNISKLFISEFSTTIFSLNNEIHDSITNVKGSLSLILKNMQLLKEKGIRVKVKMPIMQINVSDFKNVKEYCKANSFDFFASFVIFPKFDGDKSPKTLSADLDSLRFILDDLDILNSYSGISLDSYTVPCKALFYSFSIDCNGNVFPCNSFPYKVGNVYNNSLHNIWYNSKELKHIKSIKMSDLKHCTSCDKKNRCNRCPAMAYLDGNDLYGCDFFAKSIAGIRNTV
jgi:radical SAM protein with 4Fe4S-binding SPASM domain